MASTAGPQIITILVVFATISLVNTSRVLESIDSENVTLAFSKPVLHTGAQKSRRQLLQSYVQGVDVNFYVGDWQTPYNNGFQFVYIKATEGTGLINPNFASEYSGSYNVGFIRGGYHYGRPDLSDGATQANYFLQNGGSWSSADGQTLPGALAIVYNDACAPTCTASQICYDIGQPALGAWIQAFVDTYQQATGVYPVIFTTYDWYNTCVGTSGDFSATCPLWIPCFTAVLPSCATEIQLPYNWANFTFWQYASGSVAAGTPDLNVFNGPYSQLQVFATTGSLPVA